MEIIHRKISLENSTTRKADETNGALTANTFYIKLMLTQTFDNMGMFTDMEYIDEPVDYSILINKLNTSGFTFPFMSGVVPPSVVLSGFTNCLRLDDAQVSDFYKDGDIISATTESRLNELQSYNKLNRFIPNFNIDSGTYLNYQNILIDGVSRIISTTSPDGITKTSKRGDITYTFDANDDANLGTINQTSGLLYGLNDKIFLGNKNIPNDLNIRVAKFTNSLQYKAEGWNQTNTSLSALTKEEYLMGIINQPEVFNDVFIDRGETTVMEKHLKLSEVESIEHLETFGNGFYNIVKI